MNNTKITIQLYADEYTEKDVVTSILDKKFGFEMNFENEFERNRRILSLDQVKQLKETIDNVLSFYETAMNFDFKIKI